MVHMDRSYKPHLTAESVTLTQGFKNNLLWVPSFSTVLRGTGALFLGVSKHGPLPPVLDHVTKP